MSKRNVFVFLHRVTANRGHLVIDETSPNGWFLQWPGTSVMDEFTPAVHFIGSTQERRWRNSFSDLLSRAHSGKPWISSGGSQVCGVGEEWSLTTHKIVQWSTPPQWVQDTWPLTWQVEYKLELTETCHRQWRQQLLVFLCSVVWVDGTRGAREPKLVWDKGGLPRASADNSLWPGGGRWKKKSSSASDQARRWMSRQRCNTCQTRPRSFQRTDEETEHTTKLPHVWDAHTPVAGYEPKCNSMTRWETAKPRRLFQEKISEEVRRAVRTQHFRYLQTSCTTAWKLRIRRLCKWSLLAGKNPVQMHCMEQEDRKTLSWEVDTQELNTRNIFFWRIGKRRTRSHGKYARFTRYSIKKQQFQIAVREYKTGKRCRQSGCAGFFREG